MERLDKFLVEAGVGSRSQVKDILKKGRVTVDGVVERDNSRKIDPEKQTICLDGETLGGRQMMVLMLNKPAGFVTATEDKNDRTVMELIPADHLKQSYYRADSMKILGLAADKREAFDLCHKMIRDCYVGNGIIDKDGLWYGTSKPTSEEERV